MTILETKVKGIDNNPINVKKKPIPQSSNSSLPLLFNTQMYIGKKGAGKTYKLVKLLQAYEASKFKDSNGTEYKMRTIIISPTASSGANMVLNTLKSLDENDMYPIYSEETLKTILDDIKMKNDEYEDYINYKKVYDKFLRIKKIDKMDMLELQILEEHDFMKPEDCYGEIHPYVNFLLLDDLVGTGAYNRKTSSSLNNLVIKHRHMKINLIFTTQSYKAIPPIVRTNIDIYAVFKTGSEVELKKIYEDMSGYIKYEQFINLYEHGTANKNDALIIINNSMSASGTKYYKNWDIELTITDEKK